MEDAHADTQIHNSVERVCYVANASNLKEV